MDMRFKEKFIELNERYFNGATLPITFYYGETGSWEKWRGWARRPDV
jgi:hypothetical protein